MRQINKQTNKQQQQQQNKTTNKQQTKKTIKQTSKQINLLVGDDAAAIFGLVKDTGVLNPDCVGSSKLKITQRLLLNVS